jgi:hypothetical protein
MPTGDKDTMDSLFSRYRISGTRLAKLMIAPPDRHAAMLLRWHPENDRQRKTYVDYYGRARTAVRRFHRRDASEADLRADAASWRLEAAGRHKRSGLHSNARAVVEYLDAYYDRGLTVLLQQKLEGYLNGVRVTTQPHMSALDGPEMCWIWLECSESLDEQLARAKANVTLLLASRMGQPKIARVEVVHAASRRIVSPAEMPPGFDVAAAAVCERVRVLWTAIDQQFSLSPANRNE